MAYTTESPESLRELLRRQTTELVNANAAIREMNQRIIERTKVYEEREARHLQRIKDLEASTKQ